MIWLIRKKEQISRPHRDSIPRLDGPRIETSWGPRFPAPLQTGPDAHPASCTMGTGSLPEANRPGRGADHPPHLTPELKKE